MRDGTGEGDGEGFKEFCMLSLMPCAFIYNKQDMIPCLALFLQVYNHKGIGSSSILNTIY